MSANDPGFLLVSEIFKSIQGESSLAGIPFAFVRLTGCNLRCAYCDSAYAFHGGTRMQVAEVAERVRALGTHHVLLTGGEPLLQRPLPDLIAALEGLRVSIETHGEISLAPVAGRARIVMDIKTPASGMSRGGWESNLQHLSPHDEAKFVIASEADYAWAREIVRSGRLPCREVLFSAARPAPGQPGGFPGVEASWLAERILEDRLPVRFQVQLHKILWGDRRGV